VRLELLRLLVRQQEEDPPGQDVMDEVRDGKAGMVEVTNCRP